MLRESSLDSFNESMSLSVTSVGHKSQQGIATVSITELKEIPSRFQEFRVTTCFDKTLMKERCGLCKMYFHRDTINYVVPNHRIFELQKQWNGGDAGRSGRRFQSPSFLYTTTMVCKFCSQFFSIMEEDKPKDVVNDLEVLPSRVKGPKLNLNTTVERKNVAEGQRAYQSSMVDNKLASYALLPPYELSSRTRREADPWWELDFGRLQQITHLSFEVLVGVRQLIHVYVMLLKTPIGFEDPFLDRVQSKAIQMKTMSYPIEDKSRMCGFTWELPAHTQCYAIRIQLKGMQTLGIRKLIVLQGDDYVETKESDLNLSAESFASIPFETFKENKREFLLLDRKTKVPDKNDTKGSKLLAAKLTAEKVNNFSSHIHKRYELIETWKQRAKEAALRFPDEEVTSLYRVIFKYCVELNIANANAPTLHEHELLGSGLIQHSPRCDLQELHQRVRSVVRWIQTRSHLKSLGALLNSERFNIIANSPDEHLYYFMSAIKRVEYFWTKTATIEEDRLRAERSKLPEGLIVPKIQEQRGCSWCQFLIIIDLFCAQKSHLIPELAYNIENPKVVGSGGGSSDDLGSQYSYHSGDGQSVSSYGSSVIAGKRRGKDGLEQPSFMTGSICSPQSLLFSIQDAIKAQEKSLVEQVRSTGFIPFDSSFAEYKFAHFIKRTTSNEINFPKTLSLSFAKTLIPTRANTSDGRSRFELIEGMDVNESFNNANGNADETRSQASGMSLGSGDGLHEFSGSMPRPGLSRANTANLGFLTRSQTSSNLKSALSLLPPMEETKSSTAPTPGKKSMMNTPKPKTPAKSPSKKKVESTDDFDDFDFDDDGSGNSNVKEFKHVDFFRVCALCEVRFPKKAVDIKVLRKHVVKLRYVINLYFFCPSQLTSISFLLYEQIKLGFKIGVSGSTQTG